MRRSAAAAPPRREERGGVALVVALLMVPLMLLTAFTLDLGIAYAQAQAFAAGSDSAALAIAGAKRADLNSHPSAPGNCQSLIDNDAGDGARHGQEAGRRQPALRPQGHDRAGRCAGRAHLRQRHHGRT